MIIKHTLMFIIHSPVSQESPVKPAAHVHENPSTPSTQVAPFWQGSLLHSSISKNAYEENSHKKNALSKMICDLAYREN